MGEGKRHVPHAASALTRLLFQRGTGTLTVLAAVNQGDPAGGAKALDFATRIGRMHANRMLVGHGHRRRCRALCATPTHPHSLGWAALCCQAHSLGGGSDDGALLSDDSQELEELEGSQALAMSGSEHATLSDRARVGV